MKKTLLTLIVGAAISLAACEPVAAPAASAREQQAAAASRAANAVVFEKNAEIDNIARRLKLTSNPGQIGFVLLLNQAGQPIMYTSVRGKVTSGGKRLTPPQVTKDADCGEFHCDQLRDGPSDEGTYGHSGEYVFFWTTDGQYIQWNGGYLYSDKPFRTNIKPLVISTDG